MRRVGISYVPLVLGVVGLVAMLALVSDHNVRTWAIVMGSTTVASVGYAAFQELRATRAVSIARRRLDSSPFDELRREMDRARRHERPFALARIRLDAMGSSGSSALRLVESLRADGGRPAWRSTDRFWREGRNLYLLLPETSAAAATVMVRRALSEREEMRSTDWRVASFPTDGVTSGALFAALGASAPRAEDLAQPEAPAVGGRTLEKAPVPQMYDSGPQRRRSP